MSVSVNSSTATSTAGARNGNWRGGRYLESGGYVSMYTGPVHPMANSNRRVLEHRLVLAEHIGRPLERTEVVHHRDGNRSNNRLGNLMLFGDRASHTAFEYLAKTGQLLERPMPAVDIRRDVVG